MKSLFALVSASLVSVTLATSALANSNVAAKDTVFAQVFTNWVATVKETANVKECALEAEKAGVIVQSALETIAVLVLTTPSTDSSSIETLDCIQSFEQEGFVSIQ
jgi:hypothetical protein